MSYREGVRFRGTLLVSVYLIVYFSLLAGAALALWQSDVLQRIPRAWVVGTITLGIGLGVVLALVSRAVVARTADAPESDA
jgi:hypothetical protein